MAAAVLLGLSCLSAARAEPQPKAEIVPTVPHAQIIRSLAFDKDGSHLASGDANGFVKVWDTRTRQLLRTFEKDLYGINAVAFSPSGKEVAAGGHDYWALKLFDAASGKVVKTFKGHQSEILCVAFSPDGRRLASGDRERGAKIWDVASGALLFDLKGHSDGVYAVAFTPDSRQLITASFDKSIRVWDVATGKQVRALTGNVIWQSLKDMSGLGRDREEDVFISLAVSPDGKWALSGSWGKVRNVKLWDIANGRLLRVLEGQPQSVVSVGFSSDGGRAFAAGEDGKTVVWDVATGKVVRTLEPHAAGVLLDSAAMAPSGNVLATGGGTGPELWDIDSGASIGGFGTGLLKGLDLAFTPDGSRLAVAADTGVAVWDTVGGRLLRNLGKHAREVSAVAISRDGARVLTGGRDNLVKLWDVASGALLQTFKGHANWVETVALSPDGRYAASGGSGEGIIRVWEVASGKELQTLRGHVAFITALAFSPDGLRLVSGSWDGSVIVWDLLKASKRFDFKSENRSRYDHKQNDMNQSRRAIDWVGFSNDGTRILAVTHDGAVSAWDARSGAELESRPPISTYLNPVILSNDGARIFWDGRLGAIMVSDAATGKEIGKLPGADKAGGVAMTTSSDDRRLAAIGSDRVVRIWDTQSGALLLSLFNGGSDAWVALTAPGFFNASSSKAGSVLSIVRALEATSIGQTWQSLYAPDLVREALAGDPDGDLKRAAEVVNLDKVVDSGPAPLVEITSRPAGGTSDVDVVSIGARVTDRGKGIGRIEWRVNGITSAVTKAPPGKREVEVEQTLALDAGDNVIEVVAYNARNLLASPPAETTIVYASTKSASKPNLYILAIGINTYHDAGWTPPGANAAEYFPPLSLAAGDAKSFAAELQKAGAGLYGAVRVKTALDGAATRAGLDRAVDEIAAKISPRDTFILFAAAHGYSNGGHFYLIPQDYQGGTDPVALAARAVGQARLQDWIGNRIKARRALILIDTCESGALTNGYERSRTDGPASDAAVGRLHEATGRPVLTAAAAGKPAFEGYHGHGVFTWALIDALHHGDANANGVIELSELAAYVQATVPKISAELSGTGRAAIAARGFGDDRQSAHFGSIGGDFPVAARLQ